jgi:predicted MFS family arabinose efflux permease
VYNGIGRSTGAIIGGKLQSEVGTKLTFMYGAILNATLAVLLVLYTNFRKVPDLVKPNHQLSRDAKTKEKTQ